LSFNNYSIY